MRSRKPSSTLALVSLYLFFLFFFFTRFLPEGSSERPSEFVGETFVLFLAPKPGFRDKIPDTIISWRDQLARINGKVVLLLNDLSDIRLANTYGLETARVRISAEGFPQLDSLLEVAASFNESKLVGFCNSDLLPGPTFAEALMALAQLSVRHVPVRTVDSDLSPHDNLKSTDGWLVVVSRVDFDEKPSDGHVFMDGGVDMWIWNNVRSSAMEDNNILGTKSDIPPFALGRPWFDNWLTATAMQLAGRVVIDGTHQIPILHKIHKRLGSLSNWENFEVLANDKEWLKSKKYALEKVCTEDGKICSTYRLGIGTTCEAPYFLRATRMEDKVSFILIPRRNIIPCPSCRQCYDDVQFHLGINSI